jgi:hypothetical protein
MNVKFRHIGDARNTEVSKVTLLHDAFFQGELDIANPPWK